MSRGKLHRRTALITGAGRGIGRAATVLFAEHGANLVIVSRTQSELERTAGLCVEKGCNVLAMPLDISKTNKIDLLFENIAEQFSHVDILVNSAAIFDSGRMENYPIQKFRELMDTNLYAPFYLSQKMLAMVDKKAGGAIVNVSSYSGCFGVEKFPGYGAYDISKYALWGLTEMLAIENAQINVRVNQVSPSGVDTRMFKQAVPPGVKAELAPEDVASKILYLASDDSAPMTGMNIMMPEPL